MYTYNVHVRVHVRMVDIPVYMRVGVCAYAEPSAVGTTRYEETKRLIKQSQVSAAVGVRGQNKVSMLAKDLARQFSGDAPATTATTDKQQVARACVHTLHLIVTSPCHSSGHMSCLVVSLLVHISSE